MEDKMRPTKKQRELLTFIQKFIAEYGYGPSYREIMRGCNYNSPATVAVHINNLVARGHLRKKGRSARSIEVVDEVPDDNYVPTNTVKPSEEKWLINHIEHRFHQAESGQVSQEELDGLYVLVGALKVLGLHGAATSFTPRLSALKEKLS
jgi:SOS-response transcriptional repressor LexA